MRRQLRRLGLGHDPRRSVATTDPATTAGRSGSSCSIFGSWYDPDAAGPTTGRARPIAELEAELTAGTPARTPDGRPWAELSAAERPSVVDAHRLAYLPEAPVNWCPGLGTVLANEEVTADGRSERGNFPVFRRPMQQWMLRITAYADRLLDDLDLLDWTESIKTMQRNWIGRCTGARRSTSSSAERRTRSTVFTTRPDTLFGATYMVVAPEHPLVDRTSPRRSMAARRWCSTGATSRRVRRHASAPTEDRQKTGVFTGSYATNPVNGKDIPVFVADYVLMGYGTGAIMAVPAHDQRDFEFAQAFGLDIPAIRAAGRVVRAPRHRTDARHPPVAHRVRRRRPSSTRPTARSTSTA